MSMISSTKRIIKGDVVVVGGGTAGITTAISAARNGAKCILIERYGFLGGTANIIQHFAGLKDRSGKKIVGGLATEIVESMETIGFATKEIIGGSSESSILIDSEIFKYKVLEMCIDSGVTVLLHSLFTNVRARKNRIIEVVIHNKSGKCSVQGDIFVDCSGDADLAAAAGCPYEIGRDNDERTQPVSMIFRVANFNKVNFIKYIDSNPEELEKSSTWSDGEDIDMVKSDNWAGFKGLDKLVEKVKLDTGYELPRDRLHFCATLHTGVILINSSRILNIRPTISEDLIKAEIEGRKQIFEIMSFLRNYVPGFEESFVIDSATQVGIRESRRIVGKYKITVDDIVQSRSFIDSIAQGIYPIDIHDVDGRGMKQIKVSRPYQIPFRSLLPQKLKNLCVAGRCISATHEALGALRVIPTCMAMGQAAGTAAAIAVKSAVDLDNLDIHILRHTLSCQGAIIPP